MQMGFLQTMQFIGFFSQGMLNTPFFSIHLLGTSSQIELVAEISQLGLFLKLYRYFFPSLEGCSPFLTASCEDGEQSFNVLIA